MATHTDVMMIWVTGKSCYASHNAKPQYVVNGGKTALAACGDHLSRAIREVASLENLPKVTVWIRP